MYYWTKCNSRGKIKVSSQPETFVSTKETSDYIPPPPPSPPPPPPPQFAITREGAYHTSSKSHHPRNVATCFSQFIPINAAPEILKHGKGLASYAHIMCMHAHTLLLKLCIYARAC